MLRPFRIVRPVCDTEDDRQAREGVKKALLPPDVPVGTNPLLVSVACRYQRRGLSIAELVVADWY